MSQDICFDITVIDFEKICRVCLDPSENLNSIHKILFIYEGTVEELPLTKFLERYCNVRVRRADSKPQQICEKCTDLMANAFSIFSLFQLSNLRLDEILERHLSNNTIRDRSKSPVHNNSGLEIQIDRSNVDFEVAVSEQSNENLDALLVEIKDEESSQSDSDSITITKNPLDIVPDNSRYKHESIKDDVDEHIVHESNRRNKKWNHAYSGEQAKSSNISISFETKRTTLPQLSRKRAKDMSEKQLEKMYLRYQHKNNLFNCTFCEGLVIQGMDKVIDHMKDSHPLTDECILCAKKFNKTKLLMAHVASHAKKQKMVCNKCFIYFKDRDSLEAHYNSEEHKNFMSKCHICGMQFRHDFRLRCHIQEVHFNKGLRKTQCPKCGLVLKYRKNLSKHLRTHKEITDRRLFLCEHCAKSFTTSTSLKRHMLITHEGQVHLLRRYYRKPPPEKTIKPERKKRVFKRSESVYVCEYCARTLSTKTAFFAHRISHPECKDVICPICDTVLSNPVEYWRHREAVHATYVCECCHKGWPTKKALAHHRYTALRVPKFKCPFCPAVFKTSQTLDRHKLTHSTEKPFSCDLCDKKFRQQHQVNQHKLCVHTEAKRHQCHICTKSFMYNYHLKAHIRSHMGCKPFSCPYCTKCFTDTVSRHKHVKNHHPDKMDEFLVFKKLHQNEEARRVESLPVDTENLNTREEDLGSYSLPDDFSSGNENNTEPDFNEYVFSPSGDSNIDSLLENNE